MLIGYTIFLMERKEKMNANFIVVNNDYTDDGGLYERLFLYITRADKTEHGFIGAYGIYLGYGVEDVARQMREVCLLNSNQERSLWHFILSFDHFYDYWVTPDIAYTIARQFVIFLRDIKHCMRYMKIPIMYTYTLWSMQQIFIMEKSLKINVKPLNIFQRCVLLL